MLASQTDAVLDIDGVSLRDMDAQTREYIIVQAPAKAPARSTHIARPVQGSHRLFVSITPGSAFRMAGAFTTDTLFSLFVCARVCELKVVTPPTLT